MDYEALLRKVLDNILYTDADDFLGGSKPDEFTAEEWHWLVGTVEELTRAEEARAAAIRAAQPPLSKVPEITGKYPRYPRIGLVASL